MANTRLILDRVGAILQDQFVRVRQGSESDLEGFQGSAARTILDKSFVDHQAIRGFGGYHLNF